MSVTDRRMPFYIGDYLADTGDLTTAQHGAYILLLMQYWVKGPLADDDQILCNIAKLMDRDWRKVIIRVRKFFEVYPDGLLHHKRMDIERRSASKLRGVRKAAPGAHRSQLSIRPAWTRN